MSSVKEESKPVVSKAGKKRVHRRQRAKEQRTADSDRSNDEDESARETAAGKKRRQNPMLQTTKREKSKTTRKITNDAKSQFKRVQKQLDGVLMKVDYIADMQKKGGKNIYLVKWAGCSSEASTWVSGRQFKAPEKLKFARLRNVARRVIKKLLNKQKESV
ncbi:unnamed protein product, partial [Mesorhabditis belari]|uniref:Chromo domain-containing protein n=1 Tax=Mesorhabditis belari TaxID=2138241 RepID=A0AAF3J8I3_9BILA